MSEIKVRKASGLPSFTGSAVFFSKLRCFCGVQVTESQTQTLMKQSFDSKGQPFGSMSTWYPFTLGFYSIDNR